MHSPDLNPEFASYLPDEAATVALGAAFARVLHPGLVIYLAGDLGAGKTTFVRGVLRGLGYPGRVKSPTFAVVEVYEFSRLNFYHFDFYRFEASQDIGEAGFREYFGEDSVCFAEWPDKVRGLPPADVRIALRVEGEGRAIELTAGTEAGALCLKRLEATGIT